MKYIYLILAFFLTALSGTVQSQSVEIGGKISDSETQERLAGVNVSVKGTVLGTISESNGSFLLKVKSDQPLTLIFSFVGYGTREISVTEFGDEINVSLTQSPLLGAELVVTASRMEESILKSPVAIEKLDLRAIKETPAPSFYDALENLKGVQMTTSSITFKVPNTRGFNIPNNFRFVQMVDGVDMQAATLGVPLGNAIGPTELDIESVEITPGAASALYGMNAINGMANLTTKNPFLYQGLSVFQKTGINHIDGVDYDPSVLTETAVRYAKAFHNRWAFKINLSYLRATDWLSNNKTDQNPGNRNTANPNYPELSGANNPAYDGWNSYGNENNNAITLSNVQYQGQPRTFLVRRTGYWEKDLINPTVENLKLDAAIHYRLGEKAELSYAYRIGEMDGIFQRGNKIQLNNVVVQNHRVELKGANYFFRTYVSLESTGDSYNLKPLSDNLDLSHLSNADWRNLFRTTLQTELDNGTNLTTAMSIARTAADAGRVEPGTAAFDKLKDKITGINNWDHANAGIAGAPSTGGAWLKQKSRMYHSDIQWDLSEQVKVVDVLLGADFRIYEVIPDGNNFVDFSRPVAERNSPLSDGSFGNNVYYKKYGFFTQVTKTLFNEKIKISGSLRYDHNLEFDPKINPRIAIVYTVAEKHNLRVSLQNGYRFPALFEALSFVNNGNVRRVGGLSYINDGLGYLDNSYTLSSVNEFNAAYNADRDPALPSGQVDNDAALANRSLLKVTNLSSTRPEKINSFEVGYKSVLLNNRLVLDIDAYTNQYDGFLGQVEVAVPTTDVIGTDESVIDMVAANRSKQTRYRVFTNAKQRYVNYGSAVGITFNFYKKFTISGNANYNTLSENKKPDVFVTGFNTPNWTTNLSFGNREVVKNVGFNIVCRWQESFLWESPLATGNVPAYMTFDAQVSFKIPQQHLVIKTGGANIFNNRYIQYAAGPTIGALYYISITVDGLLQK